MVMTGMIQRAVAAPTKHNKKETAMRLFALAVLAITAFAAAPTFKRY
jgi:hypothetical protein